MGNKFMITYRKETDSNVKTIDVYGENVFVALRQAVNLISTVGYTKNDIIDVIKLETGKNQG